VKSQNIQGLKDESKLETIIHHVREKKLYAYCIQETWLQGDFEQDLKDGMKLIHHGPAKQTCIRGPVVWVSS
jgi:hypothetical protein